MFLWGEFMSSVPKKTYLNFQMKCPKLWSDLNQIWNFLKHFHNRTQYQWAAIAQSVQRLATGWTVRGSNPGGGEIFRTCPYRPWVPPSLLCNGYRVFPGGKKQPGRDANPSPTSSAVGHERVELYLYPLWAVRPVQSLSACTRVTFNFLPNTKFHGCSTSGNRAVICGETDRQTDRRTCPCCEAYFATVLIALKYGLNAMCQEVVVV